MAWAAAPKECSPAVPPGILLADQTQVSLIDEGGCLEGISRGRLRHERAGQLAKLGVDKREKLGGCLGIALVDRPDHSRQLRRLGHGEPGR